MNRKTVSAVFVSLALGLLAAGLDAAELRSTVGTVEVKKAGAATWTQGRPKTKIQDGDIVRTGVGSETELRMDEGHKMTLREKTTLKVDSAQRPNTQFNLVVGRIRSFVSKLKPQNKFEIKTPVAVASIRGTVFEMDVNEQGASRLSVLEGVVSYRDLAGLGAEVQVLKGQSVLVEPGAAPRPAEPLPTELQEGLMPDAGQQTAMASLKADIQRETGLASFKEYFQADAAAEMKVAQYQEGKTLIDAFGKRVRLEEYIVRPDPKQWSFVSLNTREDRFDFTRFDLYAKNDLPEDIGTVNLFSSDSGAMSNWVEKWNRFASNGGDYYREWKDGGAPVNVSGGGQQVYFDNWYVEVKADGGSPTLLSHWIKDIGNTNSGVPKDYKNFGTGTIGDSRAIDSAGFSNAQRLDYFNNTAVAVSYAASEGYSRSQTAMLDDRTSASLTEALNSTKASTLTTYTVPGGADITLRTDSYKILDDGTRLNIAQQLAMGSDVEGINFQDVLTGSPFGNRKIDVVISPSIFKKAGLLDN